MNLIKRHKRILLLVAGVIILLLIVLIERKVAAPITSAHRWVQVPGIVHHISQLIQK